MVREDPEGGLRAGPGQGERRHVLGKASSEGQGQGTGKNLTSKPESSPEERRLDDAS